LGASRTRSDRPPEREPAAGTRLRGAARQPNVSSTTLAAYFRVMVSADESVLPLLNPKTMTASAAGAGRKIGMVVRFQSRVPRHFFQGPGDRAVWMPAGGTACV